MKKSIVLFLAGVLAVCALPVSPALGEKAEAPVTDIFDRAGLAAIAENPEGSYRLAADIDLSEEPWTPIPFSGVLDGDGHVLYNMTVTDPDPVPEKTVDGNHKGYETVFAGLFSRVENGEIRNLTLLGGLVDVTAEGSCFAALLAGYAVKTAMVNCSVSGRVFLHAGGKICGVSGLAGYGSGDMEGCSADVTLALVDTNTEEKCEEFLGGLLACGYTDIRECAVKLDGYASVHGYVHNGGLVGMHHIARRGLEHRGYVKDCTVEATITFFEDNDDRRAYCKPFVGEKQNDLVVVARNTELFFQSNEITGDTTPLLPEKCAKPVELREVVPPDTEAFGYTVHRCGVCGYTYRDTYVAPRGN